MTASSRPAGDNALIQKLANLCGGYQPSQFLDLKRSTIQSRAGIRVERHDLKRVDGVNVRAIVTGPDRAWSQMPSVLYCHAHGNRHDIGASELLSGRPALIDPPYGEALAEAGFVTLCIDMPCFGERATEPESAATKRALWCGKTLFGEMLEDLAGAAQLLREMPGTDPARMGIFGLSMGATLAFWLAALDTRFSAVAHLCCFADLGLLVESGAHDLHGHYMTVPGLLATATTGEIAGLVAPRPQFVGVGALDPLTPSGAVYRGMGDLRKAYRAAGAEPVLRLLNSPDTGHEETPAMRAAVLQFFGQHL